MHGTFHIQMGDEPTARLLTDITLVEHLFVGQGINGCYVEVTDDFKRAICLIVQEWADAEDAKHRDPDGTYVP